MLVYRLCREKYAVPLNGKGAALKGGRWNSRGIEVIYASMNRSLAMAEVLVHLSAGLVPDDMVMKTIMIPDDLSYQKISPNELANGWNDFPFPPFTAQLGDNWVKKNENCLLLVPSAVTQGDYNILINPHHPDFKSICVVRMERFIFNNRFFLSL